MKLAFGLRTGRSVREVSVERRDGLYAVTVDGVERLVDARPLQGGFWSLLVEGRSWEVSLDEQRDRTVVSRGASVVEVVLSDPGRRGREAMPAETGPIEVRSAMPGRVVRVLVREADDVREGQGLVVVEAMKMENELTAAGAGRVAQVKVQPGQAVEAGAVLVVIEQGGEESGDAGRPRT